MTLRHAALAFALAGCAASSTEGPAIAAAPVSAAAPEKPSLVVLIVVDQLRPDLLTRYDSLYTGGFRRLLDEGRRFVNASHDHGYTKTAPGHASLSTGVHPMRTGIVGNSWWSKVNGQWVEVENVGDSTVSIVGAPDLDGVSPRNLLRDGLADWMLAANPASRIATVSAKDRGAVLLAARARGHVYWFAPEVGRFVSSTYYRAETPEWLDRFHRAMHARYRSDTIWTSTIPAEHLWRTRPDTATHEGDGRNSYFPHRFALESESHDEPAFWEWFDNTPMVDAATLDLAETMVTELSLGADDAPDLLGISLSAADRVGHAYGPLSREQLDNLLRLDRRLGELFTILDRRVGRGRWVAALSADHGVLTTPEDALALGERAHRMTDADRAAVAAALERAGADLDRAPDSAMALRLARELKTLAFVVDVWTHEQLRREQQTDSFALLFRRSYYPGRFVEDISRFGLEPLVAPGFLDREHTGTGHGTPHWYDRHVPFVLMGGGVAPGRDTTRVATVDMAPTLAALIGIRTPADLDGRPRLAVPPR